MHSEAPRLAWDTGRRQFQMYRWRMRNSFLALPL